MQVQEMRVANLDANGVSNSSGDRKTAAWLTNIKEETVAEHTQAQTAQQIIQGVKVGLSSSPKVVLQGPGIIVYVRWLKLR